MPVERFMRLGVGLIGHVGKLPSVAMLLDVENSRVLVAQGGKPLHWVSFEEFILDPRGMKTGADLEKDSRGF